MYRFGTKAFERWSITMHLERTCSISVQISHTAPKRDFTSPIGHLTNGFYRLYLHPPNQSTWAEVADLGSNEQSRLVQDLSNSDDGLESCLRDPFSERPWISRNVLSWRLEQRRRLKGRTGIAEGHIVNEIWTLDESRLSHADDASMLVMFS